MRAALRTYDKTRDRYLAGKPDTKSAKREFDAAFQELLSVLQDDALRGPLDANLAQLAGNQNLQTPDADFVRFEAQVLNSLCRLPVRAAESAVQVGLDHQAELEAPPNSVQELIEALTKGHEATISLTEQARGLEKREKKKKKKQIYQASAYIIIGLSCIIGNSFAAGGAPFQWTSVGGGVGAVVKGSLDLYTLIGD